MHNYINDNNLLTPNQSCFDTMDVCINQLLLIIHDIYCSFDQVFETRAILLDISKASDRVWHKGLIYKLCQHGFSGDLFSFLTDFLINRKQKQRVVLNS